MSIAGDYRGGLTQLCLQLQMVKVAIFRALCPAGVGVKDNDIARDWLMVVTRSQGSSGDGFLNVLAEIDTMIAKPGMQYGWCIIVRELDCVNTGCT